MMTPFLFMVFLSWVAPIVAPFDTGLEMLKRSFTDWVMYTTSVIFTVSPPYIFVLTKTFISHFIIWIFSHCHICFAFLRSIISFFLYAMLYGAPLSPNHSLIYSSLSSSETSPHNVAPTKRFPESTSFYFFFAQQSTALCPLFPQLLHSPLKLGFLLFLLSFMLSFFLLLFRQ